MNKSITVFSADAGTHKFIEPIMERLKNYGYTYRITTNFSPDSASDIYWFDFCDNNLICATTECADDLKKKKVIGRLHAVEYYLGFYNSINWSLVSDLIFVSDHMKRKVGDLPVRTHVIPNGIDMSKYTFKERQHGFNIAYAGNIVPNKGILVMFHYFKQLLNKDKKFKLYMVGLNRFHGRDGEYYNHYLETTGLKDHVIETGEVTDINAWLEDKDYLWQPSMAESFSLIVGEAMAKGIMPLINDFSGSKELWPVANVYQDFDQFYDIITDDYKSKEYRQFVEKYSLDKVVDKIHAIISTEK